MTTEKKTAWQSEPGRTSNARLMNIWSYLMAFVLALYVIYVKWEAGIILPLGFIGVSSGFKYGQVRVEKANKNPDGTS
jgi:hypothetical protein